MERHGSLRERIARALNAAYGDGLLSESTLAHRLDVLCGSHVIDSAGLLGDLMVRSPASSLTTRLARAAAGVRRVAWDSWIIGEPAPTLLALDWDGGSDELLVGRHHDCDVRFGDLSVSRRHARLRFRDGHWILQDLESTNGTKVNGKRVVRCQLRSGDELRIGDIRLLVD